MKVFYQIICLLCCLGCMKTSSLSEVQIVNGEEIDDTEFPFVVPIYSYLTKRLVCTGSLLNATQILTAAHCVDSTEGGLAFDSHLGRVIKKGAGNYNKPFLSYRKQAKRDLAGDFAVLEFEENILPQLPEADYPYLASKQQTNLAEQLPKAGEKVILVGFGADSKYRETRKYGKKRMAHNEIVSVSDGFIEVRGEAWPKKNTAVGESGSILHGDSGGPLISDKDHRRIIGVASFYFPVYGEVGKLDSYFTDLSDVSW